MANSNKTVVAFLTGSSDSLVADFANSFAKELPEHICKHVGLSNDALETFHIRASQGYDAVVLLHSVQEGRNAVTDVPDAKYNDLLLQLKKEYGAGRVAVVVYSMPSLQHSYNKDAMMLVFQDSQPTTFECSKCVIQCYNLHAMDNDDRSRLILFLDGVMNSPLPESTKEIESHGDLDGGGVISNAVALIHHSGPKVSLEFLSRNLKRQFTDCTFRSQATGGVESIHHFQTVLVLVDKKDLDNESVFAALTTRYSERIAPGGHLGLLIMAETDESAPEISGWLIMAETDKHAPEGSSGWVIMNETEEAAPEGSSGWVITNETEEAAITRDFNNLPHIQHFVYSVEHERYIFENRTQNDMKEFFNKPYLNWPMIQSCFARLTKRVT